MGRNQRDPKTDYIKVDSTTAGKPVAFSMPIDQQRLFRCLNPKSIAVVGGNEAGRVIFQCKKFGFEGDIWSVNPTKKEIEGIRCYRDLNELPYSPDVTFVAIPADGSIAIINQLNEMNVGGAICYASGFRELGDVGQKRHDRLLKAAGRMPVLGPNCHGFINALLGAALWPDQHGMKRSESGVAILSSSGNMAINFTLQQRGLSIAWLVSVGNQAVMSIEDVMGAALENDNISAIGLHIEGLTNLPLFVSLAKKARNKGVPIIALKTGKSIIGARITLSHTATLAGESDLYNALFERLGIGQVDTAEIFIEALKLADVNGLPSGNSLASMSCSGGEASLIADLSEKTTLEFPKLKQGHRRRVQKTLNEYVAVDNPLDYHTFIWGQKKRMTDTFAAMMSGGFDLTLLMLDFPYVNDCNPGDWDDALQAFIDAAKQTKSKVAVVSTLSENVTEKARNHMIANGVTPLYGVQQALSAIDALWQVRKAWDNWRALPSITKSETSLAPKEVYGMNEFEAKKLLQQSDMSIPKSFCVSNKSQALKAAKDIGYPVVVKALSRDIVHKSELGAVVVGVASDKQLAIETERLSKLSNTILIEEMIGDTVAELLVGVSYDAQLGHYLILGFGGTLVEITKDREILLFPVNRKDVLLALQKLNAWPLLNGFRGKAKSDINSVVETVLLVAKLIRRRKHEIVELEVNPLMVRSEGMGAIVADAVIRLRAH